MKGWVLFRVLGVFLLLLAAVLTLGGCRVWDNPADPDGVNYQGYHTVEGADEVQAHTPTDGGSLVFQRFIISEARGAEAYHLQIASSVDFGNTLYDGNSHAANIMLADAPLSLNTDYYWRGRAKQDGQWGKWTDGWKFTMTTIGGLNPADGSTTTDTTPMLSWTGVPGAAGYEVRIADSPAGLNSAPSVSEIDPSHTPASALTNLQTHYWQVRAKDGDGQFGFWSTVHRLEVALVPQSFVHVAGGTFQMGSTNSDAESNESPVHSVTVNSFYMAETEVTFDQYDAYCAATGANQPDDGGFGRGNRPVMNVTWYDAVNYCNWLSGQEGLTPAYEVNGTAVSWNQSANGYRLPTEAEWEYAARGGSQSQGYKYAGSNDVDEVGWYKDNSGSKPQPVKGKKANELGLYDMSGNVYEWCWDWYDNYSSGSQTNPTGPSSGSKRVSRGGSWGSHGVRPPQSVYRGRLSPGDSRDSIGFRPVRRTN